MLNTCEDFGVKFDITINQAKSFPCQFSLDNSITLPELLLCGVVLSWVSHLKYLGVYLVCGKKFCIDALVNCIKFLG